MSLTSTSKFGRPGCAAWTYRRAALEALRAVDYESRVAAAAVYGDESRAEGVDVRRVVELSFGVTKASLPHWSYQEHGPACYCENGKRHLAYGYVCEGIRTGLRWLREKGLAVSWDSGDRRNFWRITEAGRSLASELFSEDVHA